MKRLLHIVAILFPLAVSCEIPFEFQSESAPRIYVQAIAKDEGAVVVSPYYAAGVNREDGPGSLKDVQVQVLRNGEASARLELADGHFVASWDSPSQEGDEFMVSVAASGLETAEGRTRYPRPLVVKNVEVKEVQADTIRATQIALTLDFTPDEADCFGIQILTTTRFTFLDGSTQDFNYYGTPGYILTASDSGNFDLEDFMQVNYDGLVLGGSEFQPLTLITWKQFDGPVYRFYLNSFDAGILDSIRSSMPDEETGMAGGGIISGEVSQGGGLEPDPGKIPVDVRTQCRVSFYHLSKEFYQYAKTLYQSNFDFLSNMGFTPANFTWSNVSGGLGFVGAITAVRLDPIEIKEEM